MGRFAKQGSVWGIPAVIAVGVAVRLAVCFSWPTDDFGGDAASYTQVAQAILNHQRWDTYWPPAWPAWLAWMLTAGGKKLVLFHMPFWYLAAACLSDNWIRKNGCTLTQRIFFQGLWALSPTAVVQASLPFSQMPFTVALLLAVNLDVFSKKNTANSLLSGLTWAMAILLRPATGLVATMRFWEPEARRILLAVGFVLVMAGTVAGWVAWISVREERVVAINDANAYNFFIGNHADTPGYATWWLGSHGEPNNQAQARFRADLARIQELPLVDQQPRYQQSAWEFIFQHPWQTLARIFARFRVFWAFDTYGAAYVPAGMLRWAALAWEALLYMTWLLGLAVALFHRKPGSNWVLVFAGLFIFPYLLAFSHPIYHFPLLPILAPWALNGVNLLLQSPAKWVPGRGALYLAGWGVLIFLFYIQVEWAIFWVSPLRPY